MKKFYVIITMVMIVGSIMNPLSNYNMCKGIMDAAHHLNYTIHRDSYFDYNKGERITKISSIYVYYKDITLFKI